MSVITSPRSEHVGAAPLPYPDEARQRPDRRGIRGGAGLVRRDITTSLATGATSAGVPLRIVLRLVDARDGAPLEGASVALWHCDAQGEYTTALRGVQTADADGAARFTSIVPGCRPGRWPHLHFEVHADGSSAGCPDEALLTSQIALAEDVAEAVYALPEYDGSAQNLAGCALETDQDFAHGWPAQLADMEGDLATGYVLEIDVPVVSRG